MSTFGCGKITLTFCFALPGLGSKSGHLAIGKIARKKLVGGENKTTFHTSHTYE